MPALRLHEAMDLRMRIGSTTGYLSYIDGLRAVAVLAVVFYHLNAAWLPGGFSGVDIFFVISGFVVSASVDKLDKVGAAASFLRFYARRLRRIAPALIVCLLATSFACALFVPEAWLSDTSRETGRMAFFGFSNWVLAATGNDYFSPKVDFNAYTHTWSLGVEEQFYFVFPFLFLAWSARSRVRWLSPALFAAALFASLGYAVFLAHSAGREVEAFYLTTSRFWQLAAGVLLYQGMSWAGLLATGGEPAEGDRGRFHGLRAAGIVASAALIVVGLIRARPGHSPWPDGLWPVLGTMGLIAFVYSDRKSWAGRLLSLPAAVSIGRISYSLYLWHWPVFVLFRWTVGLETSVTRAVALLLAFALAAASYRWIERPLRHAPRLVAMPNWRFVTAAVLVVVASGWTYRYLGRHQDDYSLSVVTRNATDWYLNVERLDRQYPGCLVVTDTPAVQGNVAWVYRREGCAAKPAADARRVFVAGDSHAAGYSELLQRFVMETGRQVTLYAAGGCPLVSLAGRENVSPCRDYAQATLQDVAAKARAGDVLFLPALRLPRLSEQWMRFDETQVVASVGGDEAQAIRVQGEAEAVASLKPLAERGVRIVIEAPKPLLRAPPYRCSDWFNRGNPICAPGLTIARAYLESYRAPVVESLSRVAAQLPGASVWDPFPALCPGAECANALAGRPLFFDGDHLSGYANRLLLPQFTRHFDGLEKPAAPEGGLHARLSR